MFMILYLLQDYFPKLFCYTHLLSFSLSIIGIESYLLPLRRRTHFKLRLEDPFSSSCLLISWQNTRLTSWEKKGSTVEGYFGSLFQIIFFSSTWKHVIQKVHFIDDRLRSLVRPFNSSLKRCGIDDSILTELYNRCWNIALHFHLIWVKNQASCRD